MELYRHGCLTHACGRLRARLVKWAFRRLWVKGPEAYGLPRFWVLPGDAIGREILTHGLFEKTTLLALQKLLGKQKGTLLDVGANIGNHAVFLAPLFRRVVAFEPNPCVFRILEANVGINKLASVVAVNKGLGARAGKVPFYQNDCGNLGASGFKKSKGAKPIGALDIAAGDAELKRLGIKPAEVRAVKIDVEGLEVEVIKGLAGTLKTAKPLVLFEVLDGPHGAGIVAALTKLGYGSFYEMAEERSWKGETCRLLKVNKLGDRYYALVIASAKEL